MESDASSFPSEPALGFTKVLASQPPGLSCMPYEIDSLQELASRGSWRGVVDKVARARSLSLLPAPHDHLIYLTYNALALTKLRRYDEALKEIESIDDYNSHHYHYETYPEMYPNLHGSMLPFALRWLHALIPIKLGKREQGIDRLYLLLDFVRQKIRKKRWQEVGASHKIWRRREVSVVSGIVSVHLINKEFGVCLDLMTTLLQSNSDPFLLSKLGYLQLQIGDLEAAKLSFRGAEEQSKNGQFGGICSLGDVQSKNLVGRNKALMYLVAKDYASAVREYDECIERDNLDLVAINNKAICLMYSRDLSDSIKVLESSLERVPTVALNETLVVNLCSMYELAYVSHSDVKQTLGDWVARVAPDDFDHSCIRT